MIDRQNGSSLLEAVAAVTIAALVSAGWTDSLAQQSRALAEIQSRSSSLTLARNRLASAIAKPCAPDVPCPAGKICRERRQLLRAGSDDGEPLERIEVEVDDAGSPGPRVRLATIAPAGRECR